MSAEVVEEWNKKILEKDDARDEKRKGARERKGLRPTIFKRPKNVKGHREIPKPRAVVIGPYFFNEYSLRFNQDYKWRITKLMVNELKVDLMKYHTEMKKEEDDARSCYNKGLSEWYSSKDFQTMLLLDSFFILFVMNVFYQRRPKSQSMTWYITDVWEHMKQIKLDLLIPDNQIPFFAIKKLIECIPNRDIFFIADQTRPNVDSIEDLASKYFDDIWPMRNKEQKMNSGTEFDHLLHLFHRSRIPVEGHKIDIKEQGSKNASQQYNNIPSATELQKSATKLEKIESAGSNLLITFKRSFMKISAVINVPTLYLYDYSDEIFHNLITFELNLTITVRWFTAYSACMSCLLQREDDVKLLRESEIIASTSYNDADVVKFFKDLNRDVEDHLVPDTLLHFYGRVMEHHNSRGSKIYGDLKLQYCSNMRVGLSLVSASMLFILALLQTMYAIKGK